MPSRRGGRLLFPSSRFWSDMRTLSPALAAHLAGEVTTLAHLWRFQRRDGARFGFTDHDASLRVGEEVFEAGVGLEAGQIEKASGLAVDSGAVQGVLSAEAITQDDLAAGLWDGARCDVWRCNWQAPEERVHIFAGRIGEVRFGPEGFTGELRGLQAALNAPVGRVFARACDAELGDSRCRVDLSAPGRRFAGLVTQRVSARAFRASGLEAAPEGFLTHGLLRWSFGETSRVAVHRREASVFLELTAAPSRLDLGQSFDVVIGCDKTLLTCRDRFANVLNFRGFPDMPGPDAVIAGPGGTIGGAP